MALREEMTTHGNWLFRWRSYASLPIVALVVVAAIQFNGPTARFAFYQSWELACLAISLLGLAIRVVTVGFAAPGTSGRNTSKQKANELNSTGMYSLIRHPLYLGNFFIGLGMALFYVEWWLALSYVLLFWLYYERIMFAEEEYLRDKFGGAYLEWASQTPAFFPSPAHWKSPAEPFSARTVLKAEYHALGLIAVGFGMMALGKALLGHGSWGVDPQWVVFCPLGLGVFAVLAVCNKADLL